MKTRFPFSPSAAASRGFVFAGLLACSGCSTIQFDASGTKVIEDGAVANEPGALKTKSIRNLGICAKFPQGTGRFNTWTYPEYQKSYHGKGMGFKVVEFASTKKIFPDFESGGLVWGEWIVSSKEQYQQYLDELSPGDWAYKGVSDRPIKPLNQIVILDTPLRNRFGYRQKIYRLNKVDSASGRVVRASLVVAVDQGGRPFLEDAKAREMLSSITFL